MNKNEVVSKRPIRNDIILVACLVLLVAVGIVYLFMFRAKGDTVKVTVNGKEYATYSLSQNVTKDICTGKNNEHHNLLVISGGKAYIESATCPDGICVAHAPIFRDGESIVCLPQRVVVSITTANGKNADITV